jgi:hypothetical protein
MCEQALPAVAVGRLLTLEAFHRADVEQALRQAKAKGTAIVGAIARLLEEVDGARVQSGLLLSAEAALDARVSQFLDSVIKRATAIPSPPIARSS